MKNCIYPTWETDESFETGKHQFDKDGFCNICGDKKEEKMNLTVTNYILPIPYPDLIVDNINSYTDKFWNDVDTNILFKNDIPINLKNTLNKFNINYDCNIDKLWLPTVIELVDKVETDYIELFFEDRKITDIDKFIYSFKTLEENDIDFMPIFYYKFMNMLVDLMSKFTPVESNDDFRMMYWGTEQSRFAKNNRFNETEEFKKIVVTNSSPYPVLCGGVYKKKFFLKTARKVMQSEYWKIIEKDPNYFADKDWAKDPKLPHSYEVWWKHNEDTEELRYTMLVPRQAHSIGNDPKDESRNSIDPL